MTELMTQIGVTWTELNDMEYHLFKKINQSVVEFVKKSNGVNE